MLPTELPVEIWLLILRSLSTRDLVFLSLTCKLLKAIAENERMRRQDIDRLFSKVVNNVDRFRHLMRTTGSLIIGDFATTFFTGAEVLDTVEIFFDDVLLPWHPFFKDIISPSSTLANSCDPERVKGAIASPPLICCYFN